MNRFKSTVHTVFNKFTGVLALSLIWVLFTDLYPARGNDIQDLVGQQYVQLPQNLCPSYTDTLLGTNAKQQEYGGVICDRPESSYFLLQKLIQQNQNGKAVWQVVKVKRIKRRNQQSFVMSRGCNFLPKQQPLFALVLNPVPNRYQVLKAWRINLDRETFKRLNPQQVTCKDPWAR